MIDNKDKVLSQMSEILEKHKASENKRIKSIENSFDKIFGSSEKCDFVPLPNNPLQAVVSYIAKSYDLPDFKLIDDSDKCIADNASKIQHIIEILKISCGRSGILACSVSLADDWYNRIFDPLIVIGKDDSSVFAVVNQGGKSIAINGATGDRIIVDKKSYKSFHSFAWYFARSLPNKPLTIWEFLKFVFYPQRYTIIKFLTVSFLVNAFLSFILPLINYIVFSEIIPNSNKSLILYLVMATLIFSLAQSWLTYVQYVIFGDLVHWGEKEVAISLWDRLTRLPVSFFKNISAGDLASKFSAVGNMFFSVQRVVIHLGGLFLFLGAAYFALIPSLWVLLLVAIVAVIQLYSYKYSKKYMSIETAIANRNQGVFVQFLKGITKLRIAGAETAIVDIWLNGFTEEKLIYKKSSMISKIPLVLQNTLPQITFVIIASAILMQLSDTAKMPISDFAAFISAITIFSKSTIRVGIGLMACFSDYASISQLLPILEAVPEKYDYSSTVTQNPRGKIEVNHLKFSYDNNREILSDVSFIANPGELIAITGSSGSGKSTLFRLMLGLETPVSGSILYDDVDMLHLNLEYFRSKIGVVLQNAALMPDTILRNIIGYSLDLSEEDAWKVAEQTGCDEDIRCFPKQMHTKITTGSVISGGQRQRIALARALVKKPKIIFLDEATSALDNKTQAIVTESLRLSGATRIVIAHRLSTIIDADKILYLDNGKIVEQGTYHELMDMNGHFAAMARRQIV